jgi:hypothetical protein
MFFSTEIFRFCFISLAHFDWTDTQHGIAFSILGKKTMNKTKTLKFFFQSPQSDIATGYLFLPESLSNLQSFSDHMIFDQSV